MPKAPEEAEGPPPEKSIQGGKKVRVKKHGRAPRGPNRSKPRVTVAAHARKRPRAAR